MSNYLLQIQRPAGIKPAQIHRACARLEKLSSGAAYAFFDARENQLQITIYETSTQKCPFVCDVHACARKIMVQLGCTFSYNL